jgi:small redox-active disulfide protein 2
MTQPIAGECGGPAVKKKLQILGTGCVRCRTLTENVKAAADALGVDYELEKVTQIDQIMKFGVMYTPALAVDGVVKVSGKVPSVEEIKKLIA